MPLHERLGGEHRVGVDLVGLFDEVLVEVVEDAVTAHGRDHGGLGGVEAGLDVSAVGDEFGDERVALGVADTAQEVAGVDGVDALRVAGQL